MTQRSRMNRPASPDEIAVVRAALERAPADPKYRCPASDLQKLRVVGACGCGCDSVTFREAPGACPLADAIGETPNGGQVGLIVWGTGTEVTGLEVYDLGAGEEDLRLPRLETIVAFKASAR